MAETLPHSAQPKTVTLTRDAAGRYFVSFSVEVELEALSSTGKTIGVDLGLTHLATLSNGEKIVAPKKYAARLKYLKRQQRALARKQTGSKRREKQRLRVAKAHARVAQARNYEIHQLTTRLVRDYDVIAIEDLNVKGMSRGFLSQCAQRREVHAGVRAPVRCSPMKCEARNLTLPRVGRDSVKK